MLRALGDAGVPPAEITEAFMRRASYSGIRDYLRAVEEVHDSEAGMRVIDAMRTAANEREDSSALDFEGEARRAAVAGAPLGLLLGMPTADFLTSVELGIAACSDPFQRAGALASEINRICETRGIHYRVVGLRPEFKWTGDEQIQKNVLAPALSTRASRAGRRSSSTRRVASSVPTRASRASRRSPSPATRSNRR